MKKILIAGPCALESREQLRSCVLFLRKLGIHMIRAPLWKPRTSPGWDGEGISSLPMLLQETLPHGIIPATEVLCSEHALAIVAAIEKAGPDAHIITWIGARNQNHFEQRKIAKIFSDETLGITLMFKNQVWEDEQHWLGIYEHILEQGFPKKRLWACHRGFSPGKLPNPEKFRNLPNFEMAMRIKEKTGIKMLLDPSHIGGSRQNVINLLKTASTYDFDGYMIEAHPNPDQAKTDAQQQLSPDQLRGIVTTLYSHA